MPYRVIENPVTGERVIPRIAPTEDNGWWAVSDRYAPPGTPHDWWNAGDETAWVIVEASPGQRFEELTRNLFFLAAAGMTDRPGRPGLLQTALLAREFDDTMRLTSPPRAVQRVLFAALAPLARWRGYRSSYPEYDQRVCGTVDELEPLPPSIAALLAGRAPGATSAGPITLGRQPSAQQGGLGRFPRLARYRGPHE